MVSREAMERAIDAVAAEFEEATAGARRVEVLARYNLGLGVRKLERTYKAGAVKQLAARLGLSETSLYTAATFAESFTPEDVRRLAFGTRPLAYSELIQFGKISDARLREKALALFESGGGRGARAARDVVESWAPRRLRSQPLRAPLEASATRSSPAPENAEETSKLARQASAAGLGGGENGALRVIKDLVRRVQMEPSDPNDLLSKGGFQDAWQIAYEWRVLAQAATTQAEAWETVGRRVDKSPTSEKSPECLP